MSKSINRLSALGLIERSMKVGDRRRISVKRTPKGQALAGTIEALWKKAEDDLMNDFEEKDRRRLRKLLRRASKNLAEARGGDERRFDVPKNVLEDLPLKTRGQG